MEEARNYVEFGHSNEGIKMAIPDVRPSELRMARARVKANPAPKKKRTTKKKAAPKVEAAPVFTIRGTLEEIKETVGVLETCLA